jgi:hypothetical protein
MQKNVYTYVYTAKTDKDYDLIHDRPIITDGRTSHDKQTHNCLDYSQNLVMSPRGAECQDRLMTVTCKVTLTDYGYRALNEK